VHFGPKYNCLTLQVHVLIPMNAPPPLTPSILIIYRYQNSISAADNLIFDL
jgi:hypothetical protein